MGKNIFFVVSRMHGGGAQRVVIHVLNYLARNTKHQVTLVLFNSKPEDAYLPLISSNCRKIILNSSAKFGWYKLSKLIKVEKPDILFSTLNYINIASIVATVFSFSKLKLVIREARPISKTQLFIQKIQRLLYWRVDVFWAITPVIKQELHNILKVDRSRIRLAPNPIDILVLDDDIESNDLTGRTIVKLLYVGRLIELKNVNLILKALSLIKNDSWMLKIVGNGPEEMQLKQLTRELGLDEKVEFIGYSNMPYSFMMESDIFLLASKFEGFPNVVVEALACGNLCIANNTDGGGVMYIKSLIDSLIVADYRNPNEVANIISYFISNMSELELAKRQSAREASKLQIGSYFDQYMSEILL